MNDLYASLAWLPRPPQDFSTLCRNMHSSTADLGSRLQWLASHALDEIQLNQLARQVTRARERGYSIAPLSPFKLGLISTANTDFLTLALIATALRYGIALQCTKAPFGQFAQQALSPDSEIKRAQPEAVLIAADYRGLPLRPIPGEMAAAEEMVVEVLDHLTAIREGIKRDTKAICFVQTIARPAESCFGSLDLAMPGTLRHLIDAVNRGIASSIAGTEDLLFDVAGLAETVGLAEWHSPLEWNLAKVPFASIFLPLYADHVCRLICALRGKSRRCLVLDLDNTLWSGVIGDDGIEGIIIGQGDPTGEAHLSVQHAALSLRDRGIVLAVSSKNQDEIARLPFRAHPEMALREEHFAVFQANWNDKATNIKAIAEELSLGLDAFVLLDDNPTERGLVRRLLPQVAVPELPEDPSLYARTLGASGLFEAVTFSAEDKNRADFYRDNARRVALQKQAGDVDAYLASLEMVISFRPFDDVGRARITQLINKSNQFNLTTRRYTEAEVREIGRDPYCYTLQVHLTDIYGNNGMISVVICRKDCSDWHVDTWLMSCRVLGRRVEQAILRELVGEARHRGINRIIGAYRPTARNKLVEDHYPKLGFSMMEQCGDGTILWQLDVTSASCEDLPIPMRVKRTNPDLITADLHTSSKYRQT
jgi:FkbH-like protein